MKRWRKAMNEISGRISPFHEIGVYVGKCFRIFMNEKGWTSFFFAVIIVFVISWVSGDNVFKQFAATRSGTFAIVSGCIWVGIFNSIQSICRERAIIKREHRTGLRIPSYIFAHFIYECIICFIQAVLVTAVFIGLRGLPNASMLFSPILTLFITFFLTILCADVLGMLVSSIVKNETSAMTIMPFILIIQMVMCGIIFQLEGVAASVADATISKWSVVAICVISNVNSMGDAQSGYKDDYLFTEEHLLWCWYMLIGFIFLYIALSMVALSLIDKDKR
jgi:hypothetical protein